ncbi:MAG: DUF3108 domain-containing protein [Syntrophotaleaceae bacterium]
MRALFSNRWFQRRSLIVLALVCSCYAVGWRGARAESPTTIARVPVPMEENLSYDISFLWFDRLAEANLSFTAGPKPGLWQSELEAKTLGVAAWLTRDRIQRYGSVMDFDPQGRLRSLRYDADIIKTKEGRRHSRLKSYLFDHQKGRILQQVTRNGKTKPPESMTMPKEIPNDILTAFYNFRRGVYGELKAGGHYRIPTLGKGERSDIFVDIYEDDQRPAGRGFPKGGLLAKVRLDPEVFDTGQGVLYIWFDNQRRPALVLVEDVVGLGNVRCILREGERPS